MASTVADLRAALVGVAQPARVPQMVAYMRHQFGFLGVPTPDRAAAQRPFVNSFRGVDPDDVVAAALACWAEPEREFQYVAVDLLRRHATRLGPEHLPPVRQFVQTTSWWDTVDALAANVVGPMVANHPELVAEMDRWIVDDDLWVARTAILHQLKFGPRTDAERLFRYCETQIEHRDFFVRKAIGWALRQYASTDPDAVRAWVAAHDQRLSGLSRREALKHIG